MLPVYTVQFSANVGAASVGGCGAVVRAGRVRGAGVGGCLGGCLRGGTHRVRKKHSTVPSTRGNYPWASALRAYSAHV